MQKSLLSTRDSTFFLLDQILSIPRLHTICIARKLMFTRWSVDTCLVSHRYRR